MEQVLDEIKQYVVAKNTINIKLYYNEAHYSLIEGKKYIAVKYDDNRQLICIIYAGKFVYHGKYYFGKYNSYMDNDYAYFFDGINGKTKFNKTYRDHVGFKSNKIPVASDNFDDYVEFYEIEESFDINRIQQIFDTIKQYDNSIRYINILDNVIKITKN